MVRSIKRHVCKAGVNLAVLTALACAINARAQPSGKAPSFEAESSRCTRMASLSLSNTTITGATTVAAGALKPETSAQTGRQAPVFSKLPAFCRVAGTIRPTPDSDIKFEVWLPLSGWNQRFQGVGNGGLAGTISYSALASAVLGGYAAGSTDTGHAAEGENTANWALRHPERIKDFGERSVHEMTVKSKAVTQAFYAKAPLFSYWIGCSEGGRQGMGEAQKYPSDYNGIVAGAPVFGFTHTQVRGLALQRIMQRDPAAFMPGSKIRLLHQAVLAACDGLDGVKDGVIESPTACHFDPKQIECAQGDQPTCLSPPQVALMQADYRGPVNPRTGELIAPGHSLGFELMSGQRDRFRETPPAQAELPSAFWRYFVFDDPNWDGTRFDFDKDVAFADAKLGTLMNNMNPDLSRFLSGGGKLIHYHGWADPQPSPKNSIAYYQQVEARMGSRVRDFYRLFLVPGMGHCGGGEGTDQFDKVEAIRAWVEEGRAPDVIQAEHRTGGIPDKKRPLCPYPLVAVYKGQGDTNATESFACGKAPTS